MQKLNSEFSIENYDYVRFKLENEKIKKVYDLLGPLNFDMQKEIEFPSFYEEEEKKKELEAI
jgi:hypothetical protein